MCSLSFSGYLNTARSQTAVGGEQFGRDVIRGIYCSQAGLPGSRQHNPHGPFTVSATHKLRDYILCFRFIAGVLHNLKGSLCKSRNVPAV